MIARRFVIAALGLAALTACDYVPEGTTRYRFEADKEFDSATLARPDGAVTPWSEKLRYVDKNTFSSSGTITGRYVFSARSYSGGYYRHEFEAEPGKQLYDFPPYNPDATHVVPSGPKITGTITGNPPPNQVTVLFISTDIVSRAVTVRNARFEAEAPRPGQYRVQVVHPGMPPSVWTSPILQVNGNLDVGTVTLK